MGDGVVSTPLPTDLDRAPCVALVVTEGGKDEVVAVSTPAEAERASLAGSSLADYRAQLAADPALLLRDQASPVGPAGVRVLCASLGLVDVGACHAWLREGAEAAALRAEIEAAGVARARAVLDAAGGDAADAEGLVGAALWLVAAREAAGTPPMTEVGDDFEDLAGTSRAAPRGVRGGVDPLSDEAVRRLDLARRVDPAANRPRLAMEDRRARAASPVRGVEWQLRRTSWPRSRASRRAPTTREPMSPRRCAPGARSRRGAASTRGPARPSRGRRRWRRGGRGSRGCSGSGRARQRRRRGSCGASRGSLHGMTLAGEAFGPGPETKPLSGQQQMSGYEKDGFLDSFHGGDGAQGVAESQPFVVEDDFVGFLVGAGASRTACGSSWSWTARRRSGRRARGAATLNPVVWDLRPYRGKVATLRVVDESSGNWGHILVDAVTWLR
ncbi:MAG: hypothetical protein H6745_26770 [Deltaproteobacteria bacterium]|nr:hypothetical protein [Deltaproteobacteria bacterium]